MKKDRSICFRVSGEVHDGLIRVSREERRSLSSTIEIILSDYLNKRKSSDVESRKEKRQYPRESLSVPAVIIQADTEQECIVDITELSMGGLKISLAKEMEDRLRMAGQDTKFEVVFNLPSSSKPIRLACQPKRVVNNENSVQIGAEFVNADNHNSKALRSYLM
ncbi:MAG: PilZ domain-containing protein [Smithellaceae bacterium]|nr:PilZ domain-containing protein [Smithellaceae bacterium]